MLSVLPFDQTIFLSIWKSDNTHLGKLFSRNIPVSSDIHHLVEAYVNNKCNRERSKEATCSKTVFAFHFNYNRVGKMRKETNTFYIPVNI